MCQQLCSRSVSRYTSVAYYHHWISQTLTNPPPQPCRTERYVGDGVCDTFNNFVSCQYDGGDCCPHSCQGERCGRKGWSKCKVHLVNTTESPTPPPTVPTHQHGTPSPTLSPATSNASVMCACCFRCVITGCPETCHPIHVAAAHVSRARVARPEGMRY